MAKAQRWLRQDGSRSCNRSAGHRSCTKRCMQGPPASAHAPSVSAPQGRSTGGLRWPCCPVSCQSIGDCSWCAASAWMSLARGLRSKTDASLRPTTFLRGCTQTRPLRGPQGPWPDIRVGLAASGLPARRSDCRFQAYKTVRTRYSPPMTRNSSSPLRMLSGSRRLK